MKRYGIIGFPLAHSFSKEYFTRKFLAEGLTDCFYETFPINDINELLNLLKLRPDLIGFNVTHPYKKEVLKFISDRSAIPTAVNACNCIKISSKGLIGFNTDIIGFEKSLSPLLLPHHTNALILGNGGAAESVKYVLKKLNIGFLIVGRQLREGNDLIYTDLNPGHIEANLIIINTTPLGTYPNVKDHPILPYTYLTEKHLLYDLIYNPDKTSFLKKGEQQGAQIKNGYEMLIIQAEENWKIWNTI